MPESPLTDSAEALAIVHEGWRHLKRQSPLASWACWRRALRLEPENKAAADALNTLANAPDLPEAARAEYRFLTPVDASQRLRWDAELRTGDLGDLAVAAAAFHRLATGADPTSGDGRARFNQALCLAWLGRNADAIEALDAAVGDLATTEPGVAVDAWALAEILRQGSGAEDQADDLNYVATFTWDATAGDLARFLADSVSIRAVPLPIDPATGVPSRTDIELFEWLDGNDSGPDPAARLLATVVRSSHSLRLSGPDPLLLDLAFQATSEQLGAGRFRVRREATPLPLAFLDAAVWAIRLPVGIDPEAADAANRGVVERYYETSWIHRPRHGLDGYTPITAGQLAAAGDLKLAAKLAGVIRVREQLGSRSSTIRLYQGYPFDRLRRRVGLPPVNPAAIDPADTTTMSAHDLDLLDPKAMSELDLVEAFESAAVLGDDARTSRFAAWLADLDPAQSAHTLRRLDLAALIAVLVRQALADDEADVAVDWIDRALKIDTALRAGRDARQFLTWRAEILARTGQPDGALAIYQQIIEAHPDSAAIALDAAETLVDNGHDGQARTLALIALELAQRSGDHAIVERVERLL